MSMRRDFKPHLHAAMTKDPTIRLITADLGYRFFDDVFRDFPERCINCGVSEQLMLGIGVGLADSGLKPICHSITPFLLWRGAEWIRNYLNHEKVPVKLLGSGRQQDYHEDGFSHYAGDDYEFLKLFPSIKCYWPEDAVVLGPVVSEWLSNGQPSYLNLSR